MYSISIRTLYRPWVAMVATLALLVPTMGCARNDGAAPESGVVAASADAAPAAVPLGAESPEAVVARMKRADEKKDLRELAACVDPGSRREMAEGMFFAASMMVAFSGMAEAMGEMAGAAAETVGGEEAAAGVKEKVAAEAEGAGVDAAGMAKRFEALLAKYGLATDDDATGREAFEKALATIDQVALIGDLNDFLEAETKGEGSSSTAPIFEGELTDVQIDGDHASGKVGDEVVEFVRIDGRWFAKAPDALGNPDAEN
ncbi:MAG: hypothetical protein KA189_10620 [Thermoanaerobaculia bacterium]|jgi:hypothetical protein|nr:hypothetical protein [Thermoanaerobaculia bacterium]MBP7814049.1 hypothetical protein [Thermoanaerobaculia bacterium]MBP8845513.1 hypothetical protein [Thermoanaerobaculia bacterium]OQC38884.1 MAG: hypothetical protein BWX64_01752 [Acidobacteria bacterium ADurb.Bin051]HNZ95888.1 hypothetical protein [Thermoanaerobaculia bacterium]